MRNFAARGKYIGMGEACCFGIAIDMKILKRSCKKFKKNKYII